ncbi:MarR family transcriptional regulator [Rhodococcus sp. T2V]|uniref:MarR family winged helix-turn-helix transcriptional regulator n=1 Tax=Rhodococcus sp. T2V TaxID=3034164 RepID=UPI0023E29CC4|nr:MarR family transcriptional regulator [Rhodococcus sp. T2V]MDF3309614.1 MarR family transcriptional regulator [Rhodococcus sp. T2V]
MLPENEVDDVSPELPETEVVYSLMRTQRFLSNRLTKMLAPYGVGWTRYEIMQSLVRADREPVSVLTLAHTLERHWTSVSKAITGLERAGHVTRYLNPSNRRENLVELTDFGFTAFQRVDKALATEAAACIPEDPTAGNLLLNLGSLERRLRAAMDDSRPVGQHGYR